MFDLVDVPVVKIPHIKEYKAAFTASVEYSQPTEPATGRQVIDRIRRAIDSDSGKVRCLVCADDGAGISSRELPAIYASGKSQKTAGGRGSVGLGHLTAFARSDLRYVLYAGRSLQDNKTVDLFGGHAILTRHEIDGNPHHPHGFVRRRGFDRPDGPKVNLPDEPGGERVPSVLERFLPKEGTGSAVMLVGYNPQIRRGGKAKSKAMQTGDMILSQTARHFLVAFHDGAVEVEYREERQDARKAADQSNLLELLERLPADRTGARKQSLRTLRTLEWRLLLSKAETARLGDGVRVWFRERLDDNEHDQKRVSMFRDGMWIENNHPGYLAPRHFPGVLPFDAVVDLDSSKKGSFGQLARDAEGASHRTINPAELTDKDDQQALRAYFKELRALLLEHAVEDDSEKPYEPPELMLAGGGTANIKALPKRRPARHAARTQQGSPPAGTEPGDGAGLGHEQTLGGGEDAWRLTEQGQDPGADPRPPGDADSDGTKVKAGNSDGLATSCRPDPAADDTFTVVWNGEFRSGAAGLRMLLPSGTDQTSRRKLRPEYLIIKSIEFSDGAPENAHNLTPGPSREMHLRYPARSGAAKVAAGIDGPDSIAAADRALVRAELVHRQPQL